MRPKRFWDVFSSVFLVTHLRLFLVCLLFCVGFFFFILMVNSGAWPLSFEITTQIFIQCKQMFKRAQKKKCRYVHVCTYTYLKGKNNQHLSSVGNHGFEKFAF